MNDAVPARKIGVLGGTFDPVHNGHLAIARFALESAGLDEVVFVPAGRPWMKPTQPGASPEDRLEMVRLALEGEPGLTYADVDVKRPGDTYTVDTLSDLGSQYGHNTDFYLIVGADTAEEMHRWKKADLLSSMCTVCRHRSARLSQSGRFGARTPGARRHVPPGPHVGGQRVCHKGQPQ